MNKSQERLLKAAFEKGYWAGFRNTREGFNAEHPFDCEGIEQDERLKADMLKEQECFVAELVQQGV